MDLEMTQFGQVAVVEIPGENLEASNALVFKEAMGPIIENHKSILLDLSALQFIDSSGLGAILSCLKKINALDGSLKLCGVSKTVQALFDLVRMNRVFSTYSTRDEAIAAF